MSGFSNFFMGTPGQFDQRSTLAPQQQPLFSQLQNANQANGGSFTNAANYYNSLLSDNPASLQAMIAPDLRRFREQIVPQIGQDFASKGAGAFNSLGYRNAALRAGTDLSERIAALRANLQSQGAQGLTQLGNMGLQNYTANTYTPRTPGFLEAAAPAIGQIGAAALSGGTSAALTSILPFLMKLFNQSNTNSGVES